MMCMKKITMPGFFMLLTIFSIAQNGDGNAASKADDPKMKWWKDAKKRK